MKDARRADSARSGEAQPALAAGRGEGWRTGRAEATRRASRTFGSLHTRNYRLFATGQVISNTGSWMQRVAQDWLVLDLTQDRKSVV